MTLNLTIGGCRGSMCVSGPEYHRYGGNTTCFHVEVEPGHHLVIDAGTGLRNLQRSLKGSDPQRFTLLLTHYHWDHIQGLPTFPAVYAPGTPVYIYGPPCDAKTPMEALGEVMQPPWWPVHVDRASDVHVRSLEHTMRIGPVTVSNLIISHPQLAVAYRLEAERSVVIATDHEAGESDEVDAALVEFARGADVLLHDAQYTPEEHLSHRKGWGHSDWEQAAMAAEAAGVGKLILTSHDPDRSDDEVDAIRTEARRLFPRVEAAYEGMQIPL